MLYLAIDQHRKQLTINLRNEEGHVLLRRQVSTEWAKVRAFFEKLQTDAQEQGGYVAILEVCGFNDWLLDLLQEYGCRETVLIQPKQTSNKKSDRRDANQLGEVLWVNRGRLLSGERVQGIRRVRIVAADEQENRRLTMRRIRTTRQVTRTINRLKTILRRHNLEQQQPTKGIDTKAALQWLQTLALSDLDRLVMDQLLVEWQLLRTQLEALDKIIAERVVNNPAAMLLGSLTNRAGLSALALASRIGPIEDFLTPRSLGNYFGVTPSCHNSGESTQRLGSITKEGSPVVRYILGQLVLHVLKRDPKMRAWHRRIKLRRGSKIARVAVMRRLTVIIWHMLKHHEPYQIGGRGERKEAAS
jgi:transposase